MTTLKPKFRVWDLVSYRGEEYIVKEVNLYNDSFYRYIIEPVDNIEADEDELEQV